MSAREAIASPDDSSSSSSMSSALEQARQLQPPPATETEHAETEGAEFWEAHSSLLRDAWREWEATSSSSSSSFLDDEYEYKYEYDDGLDSLLLDPLFKVALQAAWAHHEQEEMLRNLWTEVAPGVYQAQLLNPDQIDHIRQILDAAATCGIPFRRPNAMNRYGMILEASIDGAVTVSSLTRFYKDLVSQVARPVGRLLFSEYFSPLEHQNDQESYAFTIRYKQGEDVALKEHSDASLITLNVNLNRPGEEVQYGQVVEDGNGNCDKNNTTTIQQQQHPSLYVVDDTNGVRHNLTFAPGTAMLHRGMTRHGAYPIQGGERTNLVVWLFGPGGYVRIAPYETSEQMTRDERWQLLPQLSTLTFHNKNKNDNNKDNNDANKLFRTQEL